MPTLNEKIKDSSELYALYKPVRKRTIIIPNDGKVRVNRKGRANRNEKQRDPLPPSGAAI